MGNSSTKESRGLDSPSGSGHRHHDGGPASPSDRNPYTSRTGRGSRLNLASIGLGSGSNNEVPERRETKAEIKAKKLERERAARIVERERSIREEHVDGGYLVTMGVYTGPEDFNKQVVRQLMIERRIAPFWRGLNDFKEEWTEYQLIAAGRGLPIPAADEIPPEELTKSESPHTSASNLHNLTVPLASRSQSASSDASLNLSPSHPAFNTSTPASPLDAPATSSSILRPRSKTLASLKSTSKETSPPETGPREIQLPRDPYVNGQAIEVFLYKDSTECPICFIYYPPYLNKTRCCDQPICSECFVQIKRPDPHPPEHDHNDSSQPAQNAETAEAEMLVSEPAACPYCQQSEFGVTYDPPPFRRGLAYANASSGLASFSSAMSSTSSINSSGMASPSLAPQGQKRRTTLSANAPTVITTDRIRPDWAQKLASARQHLARRSAAASALHAAAFVINGAPENRSFGFSARSRFGRNRTEQSPSNSGTATPSARESSSRTVVEQIGQMRRDVQETNSSRRYRRDDIEEMMMAEAIRLSIAAEEERKRKADKEAAKEAKKKAKEDKKKEKKERKSVYGAGGGSASGSALSLSLSGFTGRRRGNSGSSNLAFEATPEAPEVTTGKGKEVDRNPTSNPGTAAAQHLDPSTPSTVLDTHHSTSSPTAPDRPSHLRQMSTASSGSSSFVDSGPGSLRNGNNAHGSSSSFESPNASGTHLDNEDGDDGNGGAGTEPMFNFRSLAAMIDHEDDNEKADTANHIEHADGASSSAQGKQEEVHGENMDESIATLRAGEMPTISASNSSPTGLIIPASATTATIETPGVMITPETPAAMTREDEDGKQLGSNFKNETTTEIMQRDYSI
ncbi:SNF1-interacting protein [Clarireedia jacksonii]